MPSASQPFPQTPNLKSPIDRSFSHTNKNICFLAEFPTQGLAIGSLVR